MKPPAVILGGEIVGAEGEKGRAVASQEITLHAIVGRGMQERVVPDPEAGSIELARFTAVLVGGMDFVESRGQRLLSLKCDERGHRLAPAVHLSCGENLAIAAQLDGHSSRLHLAQSLLAKIRQPDYKLRDLPCQQRSVLHFDAKGRCALAGVLSSFPQHRQSSRRGPVAWLRFEVQHYNARTQLSLCLSLKTAEVGLDDRRRHKLASGVLEVSQPTADPLDHKDPLRPHVAAGKSGVFPPEFEAGLERRLVGMFDADLARIRGFRQPRDEPLPLAPHRDRKRPASQHQQVPAVFEVVVDCRPSVSRNGRAIRQHQKLRIVQGGRLAQLTEIRERRVEPIESSPQGLLGNRLAFKRGKSRLPEHHNLAVRGTYWDA